MRSDHTDIKILTLADVEAYRKLRLHGLEHFSSAFSDSLEDEIKEPISYFEQFLDGPNYGTEKFTLGVWNGSDLIGIVSFERDQRSKGRHKSQLNTMYVLPDWQGHGIGKMLVEELINKAGALPGLESIFTWVLHSSTGSATSFYKSMGFEHVGFVEKDLIISDEYIRGEYMVCNLH